jgi:hypothetical protein
MVAADTQNQIRLIVSLCRVKSRTRPKPLSVRAAALLVRAAAGVGLCGTSIRTVAPCTCRRIVNLHFSQSRQLPRSRQSPHIRRLRWAAFRVLQALAAQSSRPQLPRTWCLRLLTWLARIHSSQRFWRRPDQQLPTLLAPRTRQAQIVRFPVTGVQPRWHSPNPIWCSPNP